MYALERLMDLVPPPHNGRLRFDWATVEASVQTSLPADYKQLAGFMGQGRSQASCASGERLRPLRHLWSAPHRRSGRAFAQRNAELAATLGAD